MNRLVILGNGFDLAHGLKTTYADFMFDLVKQEIKESFSNSALDDDTDIRTYIKETVKITRSHDIWLDPSAHKKVDEINDFGELEQFMQSNYITVSSTRSRSIFNHTYSTVRKYSWADVEAIYYDLLLDIVNKNTSRRLNESAKFLVVSLNQELDFFKNRLVDYLRRIQAGPIAKTKKELKFWAQVTDRSDGLQPTNIHILNFNYTNTLARHGKPQETARTRIDRLRIEINNIHGQLDDEDSIIFGYGDEFDSYYKKMEDLDYNELLTHAKSFGYFKNNKYQRLLSFKDSGDFEVWIVGHSCGLSDRVMLKKIFEHPSCKQIKIYHYLRGEPNDHLEKTHQVSWHFSNKELMRERIKHFDPQDCITNLVC